MKKLLSSIILFSFCYLNIVQAQHQKNKEPFVEFYKRADSINNAQPKLIIDDTILKKLKELDKQQPYFFFAEATGEYEFKNDKYDYAATIFYVALIRYKYFMSVNPEYAPGEGWVICESMKQNYENRIELYLKNNIEKYKDVLKFATAYCTKNRYFYWEKPTNEVLLKKVVEPYVALLKELESNKAKYEKEFLEEKNINLGINKPRSSSNSSKKTLYRFTPLKLDVDTTKSKLDIYQYYKEQRSHHHYKYIKAKERLAVLEFIDKQNWNDSVKLEIFKLVTWDYGEKYPMQDLYQTEAEHQEWLKNDTAKSINKKQEKDTEERVIQLLGEQAGRKFLSEVIDVKIKFGEEFQKYFGK